MKKWDQEDKEQAEIALLGEIMKEIKNKISSREYEETRELSIFLGPVASLETQLKLKTLEKLESEGVIKEVEVEKEEKEMGEASSREPTGIKLEKGEYKEQKMAAEVNNSTTPGTEVLVSVLVKYTPNKVRNYVRKNDIEIPDSLLEATKIKLFLKEKDKGGSLYRKPKDEHCYEITGEERYKIVETLAEHSSPSYCSAKKLADIVKGHKDLTSRKAKNSIRTEIGALRDNIKEKLNIEDEIIESRSGYRINPDYTVKILPKEK